MMIYKTNRKEEKKYVSRTKYLVEWEEYNRVGEEEIPVIEM